jgi:hypothetical protein
MDENVLQKSSNGPRHDSAAGHRQWSFRFVALMCTNAFRLLNPVCVAIYHFRMQLQSNKCYCYYINYIYYSIL